MDSHRFEVFPSEGTLGPLEQKELVLEMEFNSLEEVQDELPCLIDNGHFIVVLLLVWLAVTWLLAWCMPMMLYRTCMCGFVAGPSIYLRLQVCVCGPRIRFSNAVADFGLLNLMFKVSGQSNLTSGCFGGLPCN